MIEQIKRLAKMRPKVFGADGHRWRWNPPLPETKVVSFEREHGIRLPEEYRSFITTIANGGAGPFYGIFRFGETDESPMSDFIGDLSRPFPYTNASNDLTGKPPEDLHESDEDEYWRQIEEFEKRYWAPVAGPEAGKLWTDDRASDNGWIPMRVTFAQWYEHWLEKSLRGEDAT